jgi:hypothetical protein
MALLEVGWSLPPRGRDRPRRPLLGTADGPRRRESCRGDRGASAATDDRSRDHRVPRDRALHRLGVLARVGLGKLTASSRPRPRIVMSASERASWLGVRPRLRRRCHPRSLGRCSRRREGDHRDTRPSPSRRDFYLSDTAVVAHLQGDPPGLGFCGLDTTHSPCSEGRLLGFRPIVSGGSERSGLIWRGVCQAAGSIGRSAVGRRSGFLGRGRFPGRHELKVRRDRPILVRLICEGWLPQESVPEGGIDSGRGPVERASNLALPLAGAILAALCLAGGGLLSRRRRATG